LAEYKSEAAGGHIDTAWGQLFDKKKSRAEREGKRRTHAASSDHLDPAMTKD
jgi:hypothetical protein